MFKALATLLSASPQSNPFKCPCCNKRILEMSHAPVPVCDACFSRAAQTDPRLWEWICTQFRSELRAYIKKTATRPSSLDVLSDATQALNDVLALQKRADNLRGMGLSQQANDLQDAINQTMQQLSDFRRETPEVVAAIAKDGES